MKLKKKERELKKESKALEEKKDAIIQKAKKEARDLLLDAESEANDIIKELTNLRKNKEKNVNKAAEEARTKLKSSISQMQKDLAKPKIEVENALSLNEIKVGMKVFVPSIDQEATIVSLPDKKEKVMVQSGIIKLAIHISNLEKISEKKNEVNVKINNMIKSKVKDITTEIKLLGMTVDEATAELEKYLDDAYLAGLKTVRVVHGKGSGALRRGVQEYLKKNPHVSSHRLGMYGEGDSGVTIVELK